MDMGEVVFDSSCVTQRVPPLRELWSRFPRLDAPPWLSARLHGTHIVSWHCQSRQVTVDVLLLPTLGHLARCLLPSPSFSLAKQMQANRQNTIFFFFSFSRCFALGWLLPSAAPPLPNLNACLRAAIPARPQQGQQRPTDAIQAIAPFIQSGWRKDWVIKAGTGVMVPNTSGA